MKVVNKADFIAQLEVEDSKKERALNDLAGGDVFYYNSLTEREHYMRVRGVGKGLEGGQLRTVQLATGRLGSDHPDTEVTLVDCTLVIEKQKEDDVKN